MLTYLKAAIFTIAVLVCALIGYMLLSFNSDYEANLGLDAFLRGDYVKAEEIVNRLQKHLSDEQYHLDLAYIERARDQLSQSDQHLRLAAQAASQHNNPTLGLEIALNQAYNGYLSHNQKELQTALEQASELGSANNEWVKFFATLGGSGQTHSNTTKLIPMSPWMKKAFDQTFTPFWNTLHKAKWEIESGHTLQARQQMEERSQHASPSETADLQLVLGLSYLKEAEQTPALAATPYYKLAFGYFGRVPLQNERYTAERKQIIQKVNTQLEALLELGKFQDLAFYTQALESLNATPEIDRFHSLLIRMAGQQLQSDNWPAVKEIATVLNRLILDPEKRQELEKLFLGQLKKDLDNENFSNIQNGLEVAQLFSTGAADFSASIHQTAVNNILDLIPVDNSDLSLTLPQIDIWLRAEQDPKARYAFALELLSLAEVLWMDDSQTDKALALSLTAAAIPALSEQKAFTKRVETSIRTIYNTALQRNDLVLLQSIQKALRQLNLSHLVLQGHQELASQFDQAQRLFNEKEYEKSAQKALWILQADPTNQQALRIAGLSEYQQTHYTQALQSLRKIDRRDPAVSVALAVSESIAGDPAKGKQLLDQAGPLQADAYLRLGFGLLLHNNPAESIAWFKKVNSPEAKAGQVSAFYALQDWGGVVAAYGQLISPYSDLVGLKSQTYDALVQLGQFSEADELSIQILKKDITHPDAVFPFLFQNYKKSSLDYLSSDFLKGLALKNSNDHRAALASFLTAMQHPHPLLLLEIGDLYYSRGQPFEARLALLRGIAIANTLPNSKEYLKRALPLLAEIEMALNLKVEAWRHLDRYFEIAPHEFTYRSRYAQLLMELQRYDLALLQLRTVEEAGHLTEDDRISYVACLVHANHFDEAQVKAKSWAPALDLPRQLKMARWLLITGDATFAQKVLESASNPQQISAQIALLALYREMGDYEKAGEAASLVQTSLLKASPELMVKGLLELAELQADLSNPKAALQEARQALALDPGNRAIWTFIEPYETSITAVQGRLAKIEKEQILIPDSPSLQMEESHALIDLAIEQHAAHPESPIHDISALRRAHLILDRLLETNKDLPRLYYLKGEASFLLDDPSATLSAFQEAVRLDVSYVQAYKYLGIVYAALQKPHEALQAMKMAITFAPCDSDAWSELAEYTQKQGMDLDALQSWQQVIKYHPRDSFAYYSLGLLKSNLRDIEGARTALEKAVELSPQNGRALKLLLVTLYDPQLGNSDSETMKLQRQKVYDALHAIDSKQAESLLSELTKSSPNP